MTREILLVLFKIVDSRWSGPKEWQKNKYVVFEFPSAVDQAVDKENLNNIGKFS